jgi:hypothetical protein
MSFGIVFTAESTLAVIETPITVFNRAEVLAVSNKRHAMSSFAMTVEVSLFCAFVVTTGVIASMMWIVFLRVAPNMN